MSRCDGYRADLSNPDIITSTTHANCLRYAVRRQTAYWDHSSLLHIALVRRSVLELILHRIVHDTLTYKSTRGDCGLEIRLDFTN